MSDPAVAQWRQRGQVYIWRYSEGTRKYPGWHMTADSEACVSLLELIDKMQSARWPSSVAISISRPINCILRVPNNRGGMAHWTAPEILKLKYGKDQVAASHWSLEIQSNIVTMVVGSTKLSQLRRGISDIANGNGDYSIDSEVVNSATSDTCLWFWWLPRD